jgi:3-oxoacyl-[acyl-carrier protein] reductase
MGQLEGRVALVSGGGRGIGKAISELLASEGATVAVNYRRDADAAAETVATITAAGGRATAHPASVDDPEQCAALVEEALAAHGPIDLLVCNAGVASRGLSVVDTQPDEIARLMTTHAFSAHYLSRLVLPAMRTCERGDIVMISSMATTFQRANSGPYTMAKAALEALAMTLAKEEQPHGIHVNVCAPGLVETAMGVRLARALTGQPDIQDLRTLDATAPFGRSCQPIDVARVVLWLCSEGAGYVTGQRIECNGGG